MSRRTALLVAAAALLTLTVAWGATSGSPADLPTDSVLLGPTIGQQVSAYVAASATEVTSRALAQPAQTSFALLALTGYVTADGLTPLLTGLQPLRVVVRVPLPRVQTAVLQFAAVGVPADVRSGMARAADDLAAQARSAPDPVSAAVADAQVRMLRANCACVYAVVVQATAATLAGVIGRAGIRAVQIAPAGQPLPRLAFAPLLPEQLDVVSAPPDDGAAAQEPAG